MHPIEWSATARPACTRRWSVVCMFLVFLSLASCRNGGEREVPTELAGMSVAHELTGTQAQQVIDRLHGKGVTPERNLIRTYTGPRGAATLYVSWYAEGSNASREYDRMASRLRKGVPAFTGVRDDTVDGQPFLACQGLGQLHYLFARRKAVYWLAVEADSAAGVFAELLGKLEK